MGHEDITTTMIYVHHVPQHDAADRFQRLVASRTGSRNGSRNAPSSVQLSATEGTP